MKRSLFFAILTFFLPTILWAQLRDPTFFKPAESSNKARINLIAYGGGGAAVASLTGLYFIWYADYDQSSFHFTDDWNNWGQMDKIGHAATTYNVGLLAHDALRWSGVSEKKSIWYGGLSGWSYLAIVEVMDGVSTNWGFSGTDLAFNTLGSALFMSQQFAWNEQRFSLKFSTHATEYSAYRPDLLGSSWQERWLKDYNGQTYWLSVNPWSFTKNENNWWPRWLNVAGGYGIDGFVSADGSNVLHPEIKAQRQYYLSFDVDLRRIKVKNDFLRTVLHTINFIKFPAPALEINQSGNAQWHWVYF